MIGSRFALIPILAGVGYEVLRLGARFRHIPLMRVIMYPGILVQMITTKRPTDDMIEVAITSMQEALAADGNEVPEGSTMFERSDLELPRSAREGAADLGSGLIDEPAGGAGPSPAPDARPAPVTDARPSTAISPGEPPPLT